MKRRLLITIALLAIMTTNLTVQAKDKLTIVLKQAQTGCVLLKPDTNERLFVIYEPWGATIVNDSGVMFYYYDETGESYNITDGTSIRMQAGLITKLKRRAKHD